MALLFVDIIVLALSAQVNLFQEFFCTVILHTALQLLNIYYSRRRPLSFSPLHHHIGYCPVSVCVLSVELLNVPANSI